MNYKWITASKHTHTWRHLHCSERGHCVLAQQRHSEMKWIFQDAYLQLENSKASCIALKITTVLALLVCGTECKVHSPFDAISNCNAPDRQTILLPNWPQLAFCHFAILDSGQWVSEWVTLGTTVYWNCWTARPYVCVQCTNCLTMWQCWGQCCEIGSNSIQCHTHSEWSSVADVGSMISRSQWRLSSLVLVHLCELH